MILAPFIMYGYTHSMTLAITIKPNKNKKKIYIEMDAERFEQFAANLGLFNPDFLKSIERSERDVAAGRVRRLRSLHDLRRSP